MFCKVAEMNVCVIICGYDWLVETMRSRVRRMFGTRFDL